MRKIGLYAAGGLLIASFYAPASAQSLRHPAIDCGTPQNALTYYCNNRDQFNNQAPVVTGRPMRVIIEPEMDLDVGETGSIAPIDEFETFEEFDDESEMVIVR